MPENLKKMLAPMLEFWNKLEKAQRTRMLVISAILFVAVTAGILFATRTEYVPLLTVDNPRVGQEVEKVLNEKQIRYKPGVNGKIMVDIRDKNQAEFALALTEGVGSSVNFDDVWSKLTLTSTESDKKHLWQNFKKSSLIAKLKMFENVRDADVDLSLPEKSMFFTDGEADKPKAFVRIDPRGDLTSEQVQGIAKVVAASIEGLKPSDVTVVDSNFNILSNETSDDLMDRTGSQYKMRLQVKSDMENSVKRLYSGRSDSFDFINVVANPVLDFSREKRSDSTVQKPTDLEEAVISSNIVKETLENGTPGGEPGINTNPGVAAPGSPSYPISSSSGSSYEKKSETKNYEYNRSQSEFEKAVGTISYADSSLTVALWYGQRVTDDSKISNDFINRLKQDVAGATGVPLTKISVNKYKLAAPESSEVPLEETVKTMIDNYGFFGLILLMVIGMFFALKPKKRKLGALGADGELATAGGPKFVVPDEDIEEIDVDGKSVMERQIEDFVERKPETVAQLLRNWIQDGW